MPARETQAEKWERAARLLKAEDISNVEAAERLGLCRNFVARVRADLGLPTHRPWEEWNQNRFEALTRLLPGGHRIWLGRCSPTGVPMAGRVVTAHKLAYRLHHGRLPLGRVRGTCTRSRCVAGGHQEDDVLRAADPARLSLHGMDLVAIRKALRGEAPYPSLDLAEQRMAFRLADPAVGVVDRPYPAVELAERLGCHERTVNRWRSQGVPV